VVPQKIRCTHNSGLWTARGNYPDQPLNPSAASLAGPQGRFLKPASRQLAASSACRSAKAWTALHRSARAQAICGVARNTVDHHGGIGAGSSAWLPAAFGPQRRTGFRAVEVRDLTARRKGKGVNSKQHLILPL